MERSEEYLGGLPEERTVRKASEFLKRLAVEGGAIVSSARCSVEEIQQARREGRLFVDWQGLGYVLRLEGSNESG